MVKKTISGRHNGHEFVEIGGIKWATCNVGAKKPTDTGLYFQWGDRKGYTADEVGKIKMFNRPSYKHYNGKRFTKYNQFDGKLVLDLCDDAAFSYMGQEWRMPTQDDIRCLFENTTHWWTFSYQDSGVAGIVFTDITDSTKELFFPATGYCLNGCVNYVGSYGSYWSRSLSSDNALYAHRLYVGNGGSSYYIDDIRYYGYPIRGILTD